MASEQTKGTVFAIRHGVRDNDKDRNNPPIYGPPQLAGASPIPPEKMEYINERNDELAKTMDMVAECAGSNGVIIIASPFLRAQQTANMSRQYLKDFHSIHANVIIDESICELSCMIDCVRNGDSYSFEYEDCGEKKTLECKLETPDEGYERFRGAIRHYIEKANDDGYTYVLVGHADMISASIPKKQAETVYNVPEHSGIIISEGVVYCSASINCGEIRPSFDDFVPYGRIPAVSKLSVDEARDHAIVKIIDDIVGGGNKELINEYYQTVIKHLFDKKTIESYINILAIEKIKKEIEGDGGSICGTKEYMRENKNTPQ